MAESAVPGGVCVIAFAAEICESEVPDIVTPDSDADLACAA